MDASFKFSVESSKLQLLIAPVALPYCERKGIGKFVVCDEGIHISVSARFDPAEPVDASVWIKPAALTDFVISSSKPIAMTVNLYEFSSILVMSPDTGLLTLEKESDIDKIFFRCPGREILDLHILPITLPRFLDCHYMEGSRADLSPTSLFRLSTRLIVFEKAGVYPTVSVLVKADDNSCVILPPLNNWDPLPLHNLAYTYCFDFTMPHPSMLADAVRVPLTRVTLSLLQAAPTSVLLELSVGFNHSFATMKFVLKTSSMSWYIS